MINNTKKIVTQAQKDLIDKLLLERFFLRGIASVMYVSWRWLQNYINNKGSGSCFLKSRLGLF